MFYDPDLKFKLCGPAKKLSIKKKKKSDLTFMVFILLMINMSQHVQAMLINTIFTNLEPIPIEAERLFLQKKMINFVIVI